MTAELQVRLMELSAPGRLVDWVQPFPDLESCWNACTSPEVMLWLAARLCTTAGERRAVVACLAELTRRAERAGQHADPPVERAASTVETWVRTGAGLETGVGLDELLAAERAALDAAAWAGIVAAEQGARARRLFRSAPRGRPASFGTSQAIGAVADWREAERARQLALAAAGAARAAAEAARAEATPANAGPANAGPVDAGPVDAGPVDAGPADAARSGGGAVVSGDSGSAPGSWEYCVGESAGYAVSALSPSRPSRQHDRAARKAARLIRRRLPCPRLD
jgi:hypothetical protein